MNMKNNFVKILLFSAALTLTAASCNMPGKQAQVSEATINVSQDIEAKGLKVFSYKASEHKNALDMLKASHEVKTKSFGDAGEFVESIDGTAPDAKHFWAFYVNGQSSNVGAGSYELKDGDAISWKLEEIK
jgi:hypothetical protein